MRTGSDTGPATEEVLPCFETLPGLSATEHHNRNGETSSCAALTFWGSSRERERHECDHM